MKIGAVITAAGLSSRMGQFKPLLQIGSISTARRVVSTLQQGGAELVAMVTGNREEQLKRHLSGLGVVFISNPDYADTDMFYSASLGFSYMLEKCEQVLFTPVDVPLFTADTVRRLLQSPAEMAVPVCNGKEGHPIMLRASAMERILEYTGGGGLRMAVPAARIAPATIPVQDAGVLFDMDTPEDYSRMLQYHNTQLLRPLCSLSLAREEPFFNADTALFLELIAETGSVRGACERLNISYSKAWKLLSAIEKNYGAAVEKKRGGASGGETLLSPAGEALLSKYTAFEAECKAAVQEAFDKHFGEETGV